jgi:drug/metabolite transporter (DMT)-like permease
MQQTINATAGPRQTANSLIAFGLICLTTGLFACLDATAKYLVVVARLPVAQVVWARFLGQLLVIVLVVGMISLPALARTTKAGHQWLRSLLLLGSTVLNILALRHLRLDQTTTINFLTPLSVALLAGPLLGEWVGWRRLAAILVGFCGILVAMQPGFQSFEPAFLFSFACMLCYTLFSLSTRFLTQHDSPATTLFYSLLAGTICVAPFAIAEWQWPAQGLTWLLLMTLGIWGAAGHYLFIIAHQFAPASIAAPFTYIGIVTYSTLGYLVFGQIPDVGTLTGAAIVIASGLYLVHRERIRTRQVRAGTHQFKPRLTSTTAKARLRLL